MSKESRKNEWKSEAAKRLLQMAGNPGNLEEAVQLVVGSIMRDLPCPPTNLEAIAERVGVIDIVGEDLPVSGELRRNGKKLKIVYSNFLSSSRRQFTIAHEIGHAIFENSGARPPRRGVELEAICDMLASELLMPNNVFTTFVEGEPSIPKLLEISKSFKTSLLATSIKYTKANRKVSVFHLNEKKITWGCGIVKKGNLRSLDYTLKTAINRVIADQTEDYTFVLNHSLWNGEWKLDCMPLSKKQQMLFMLYPLPNKKEKKFYLYSEYLSMLDTNKCTKTG